MEKSRTLLAATGAAVVAAAGVLVGAGGPAPAVTPARTPTAGTVFSAASFGHPVSNPYYPLRPGTTTVLRGSDRKQHYREHVRVTRRSKVIQGVRTRVIRDVLRRTDGSLAERTTDWYADDDNGNVWYFGERTATYDRQGHVLSREGTWQAGAHGARAGLIMPAKPHATQAYRQEYWANHAEDQAWIVGFKPAVQVPLGRFRHVVRSFEWSRLEPHVLSLKLYARGVGIVREQDLAGGSERFQAVKVRHG